MPLLKNSPVNIVRISLLFIPSSGTNFSFSSEHEMKNPSAKITGFADEIRAIWFRPIVANLRDRMDDDDEYMIVVVGATKLEKRKGDI